MTFRKQRLPRRCVGRFRVGETHAADSQVVAVVACCVAGWFWRAPAAESAGSAGSSASVRMLWFLLALHWFCGGDMSVIDTEV
ncbi:hypothetical protein M3J09_002241 [Ascochyta lentis]